MLKKEIETGKHYAIRHHTDSAVRLSVVRVERESPYGGWICTKLKTGREIRVKSAAKFRYEVLRNPDPDAPKWITKERFEEIYGGAK